MIITAGVYKGRRIYAPDEKITRPTLSKVRMGVFNTLYSILGDFDGKIFLDMFGGSGIMGLEALSRGFSKVKVFEKNPSAAEIIKKNYKTLGLKPDLTVGDSLKIIKKTNDFFDVVYIDPPYMSGVYLDAVNLVKSDLIIAEHSEALTVEGFDILKEKNYGGKYLTFLSPKRA